MHPNEVDFNFSIVKRPKAAPVVGGVSWWLDPSLTREAFMAKAAQLDPARGVYVHAKDVCPKGKPGTRRSV